MLIKKLCKTFKKYNLSFKSFFLDFVHEICGGNPAAENHTGTSKYEPQSCDRAFEMNKGIEHCETVANREEHFKKNTKRPLDTNVALSSQNVTTPPLKKSRGFQLILKAASKLK